jgi:hypothetical protein
MRSLSTEERREAITYMALVHSKRHDERKSGDAIARELKFPSVPRMYQRMEELECPRWAIYPETPKKRRAWGKDPTTDEIPIADFMDLFEEGVQKLKEALEEVPYLKQWIKDDRFISQLHYPEESGRATAVYRKEVCAEGWCRLEELGTVCEGGFCLSKALWEARCKRYGYDPDETEEFRVPIERVRDRGAGRHPDLYLIWLTAAYALTGGELTDLPKAEEKRKELLNIAGQLAMELLGGRAGAGRPPQPISVEEQENARLLQWAAREGAVAANGTVIDKEKWLPPEMRNLTPDEIRRLLSLHLPDARGGGD